MTESGTSTGSAVNRPPALRRGHQIRMYRATTDGVEPALVDSDSFDAHVSDGWTVDDPAFAPDVDVVALAIDASDRRVLMQATFLNPAGQTKRVTPDDVAWHQQNGWVLVQ